MLLQNARLLLQTPTSVIENVTEVGLLAALSRLESDVLVRNVRGSYYSESLQEVPLMVAADSQTLYPKTVSHESVQFPIFEFGWIAAFQYLMDMPN